MIVPAAYFYTLQWLTLRRYAGGCSDLTIGTTYSNRPDARFDSMIGPTIDVPALRVDLSGSPTVPALLARVKQVVAEALTRQDVPGGMVDARASKGPLFRAVFSLFPDTADGKLTLPGIEVSYLEESISTVSRPDAYLIMWEKQTAEGPALGGYWLHKKDAFAAETAEEMSREFASIVDRMAAREELV